MAGKLLGPGKGARNRRILITFCLVGFLIYLAHLWDTRTTEILVQKRKILGERPSGKYLSYRFMLSVFTMQNGNFFHAEGGVVRLKLEDGLSVLEFEDIPKGDTCWRFVRHHHVPGIVVQIDSVTVYGPKDPITAQDIQRTESTLSHYCGKPWYPLGTVTIKFILPKPPPKSAPKSTP